MRPPALMERFGTGALRVATSASVREAFALQVDGSVCLEPHEALAAAVFLERWARYELNRRSEEALAHFAEQLAEAAR